MKLLKRKGQGATEYLLMLAAVLVIVAVAVYYVTRPRAPTFSGSLSVTAGTLRLTPASGSGTILMADWEFKAWMGETAPADWTAGTDNLKPGEPVNLGVTASSGQYWHVLVRHKPTATVYPEIAQTV